MSTYNRIGNVANPYQGKAKKVLCLCSAGLLRSPTMANVLHQEFGYNTRAAGVDSGFALIVADEVLMAWADEIVCVEQSVYDTLMYRAKLILSFDDTRMGFVESKTKVLDIPDQFSWNDKKLRSIIKKQYEATL